MRACVLAYAGGGAQCDSAALAQRDVVMGLLGRLRELTEWGQGHVLELAAHYVPENDSER